MLCRSCAIWPAATRHFQWISWVLALTPLRVIQGHAPWWVREWALEWVGHYQHELLCGGKVDLNLATPLSRQVTGQFAFVD